MMMKTHYKRIIGVMILTVSLFIPQIVLAADSDSAWEENTSYSGQCSASIIKKLPDDYDVHIDYTEASNNYVISMGKKNGLAKRLKDFESDIKLKPVEIRTYSVGEDDKKGYEQGTTISTFDKVKAYISSDNKKLTKKNNTIVIPRADAFKKDMGFEVDLIPDGYTDTGVFDACKKDKKDTVDWVITVSFVVQGSTTSYSYEDGIDRTESTAWADTAAAASIDCSKTQKSGSFEEKFCEAKNAAIKAKNSYTFDEKTGLTWSKKFGKNKPKEFKCDYEKVYKEDDLKGNNYYKNKKYMYGKSTKTKSTTYKYNYEWTVKEGNPGTETASCEIECEEAVKVEYGPPVASKAGLCFEYKVKVTSYVSCGMTEASKKTLKPPSKQSVCVPYPICRTQNSDGSYSGKSHRQGGPNIEFDSCIKQCDGGKYTDKCSKKCYNKVYGSTNSKQNSNLPLNYADKMNTMLSSSVSYDGKGYYYSGSSLVWDTGSAKGNRTYGTGLTSVAKGYSTVFDPPWHKNNNWGTTPVYNCYAYNSNGSSGIPRACDCGETCYWDDSVCVANKMYLNDKTTIGNGTKPAIEKDAEANKTAYEALKAECKAAASCTTTEGEFVIAVDYINGSQETKTIRFPFEINGNKRDKLQSQGKVNENSKITINKNKKENLPTILSYDGCYEKQDANTWYQSEWSFPGSWLNTKTHEVSYKKVTTSGWKEYDKKFCIPLDAQNVNTKWWVYYYAKLYANDPKISYNNVEEIVNTEECTKTTKTTTTTCNYGEAANTKFTDSDDEKKSDFKWNLRAMAENFGQFEWDIRIKCFYALYSDFDCTKTTTNKTVTADISCAKKCEGKDCDKKKSEKEYRVRSVDLTNLFPGEDGDKVAPEQTGRTPGYNWSKHAEQTTKDPNYTSKPSDYTVWVQKKGYDIYSDNYLDYYIELDKDAINRIKSQSKNKNYTKYEGDYEDKSVSNYVSNNLIRNKSVIKKAYYPETSVTLRCNNIGDHTPGQDYRANCETEFK